MQVIKPPQIIQEHFKQTVEFEKTSIFLAGSIEMGAAENWQDRVERYFANKQYPDFYVLFNPRRDKWDSSWEQSYESPEFYQQVSWEMEALDRATRILMYFDPNTKSPISLLELGLYASSGKLIVVCPKEFWRNGNVEAVCQKYMIPLYRDLDEALKEKF